MPSGAEDGPKAYSARMDDSLRYKKPNEYLQPQFLDEYDLKSNYIYNELVTIDCQLTYLEKIAAFSPCLDFIHRDKKIFLTVAYVTFFQGALLRLWKLLDGPLEHLHDLTRSNVLPEYAEEFDRICGSARVTKRRVDHIRKKVDEHRNSVVAHFNLVSVGRVSLPHLPLADLRRLFHSVKETYACLSPGTESITLPLDYFDTSRGQWDIRADTDLDLLLLFLLKESPAIREPESTGSHWDLLRARMTAQEIERLNHCRKLGELPPI